MSINHIVTPLDSAVLDSKEQYVFYHKMVDFVLKELITKVQYQQICSKQEIIFFKQYCDLLLYSIEAMRIKYMYDEEDNMKIDLTESGFPNYLEFRYLFNDLSLRNEYVGKALHVKTEVLKQKRLGWFGYDTRRLSESYVAKSYRADLFESDTPRQATQELDHPDATKHRAPCRNRRAQSIGPW